MIRSRPNRVSMSMTEAGKPSAMLNAIFSFASIRRSPRRVLADGRALACFCLIVEIGNEGRIDLEEFCDAFEVADVRDCVRMFPHGNANPRDTKAFGKGRRR